MKQHRLDKVYPSAIVLFTILALLSSPIDSLLAEDTTPEGTETQREEDFLFSKDNPGPDSPILDTAFEEPDSEVSKPGEWEDPEIPGTFPELQILDELGQKKSMERMQKARSLYKTAGDIMQEAAHEFETAKAKIEKLPAQYDWQKREKEQRIQREKRQVYASHRNEAVGYLIESMKQLDKVANPEIKKSDPFLNLKGAAIREYVKLQFQSGNAGMTISVLEDYLKLKEEHAKEPEPYRLLAIAYRTQEASAREMGREEAYLALQRRKNENVLKYAELKYGKDSYEYKRLKIQVDRTSTRTVEIP
jgi:hypothetical protein